MLKERQPFSREQATCILLTRCSPPARQQSTLPTWNVYLQNTISSNIHSKTSIYTNFDTSYTSKHKQRVPRDMLLQTAIAMVTLQPQGSGKYEIQQVCLGFVEDRMDVVGLTMIEEYPIKAKILAQLSKTA